MTFIPEGNELYFLPLGGCGIFGGNMSLYGHQGKWLMVDCGMAFADDTMPGVDVLLPDPSFIESQRDRLAGIVLTHGHEDHIGAIEHFWPRLQAPIYATPFTAELLRHKLSERDFCNRVEIHNVPLDAELELDPFRVQFIRMAHSIPEANALAISAGDIGPFLHTGDWKIDPEPVVGELTDQESLEKLGKQGVLAVVGDSTNAMVPGHSGSEIDVQRNLTELFSEFDKRIVVACFSSNVARLESIARAAEANGRCVALAGRSLWRIHDVAKSTGYLKNLKPFLEADEVMGLPRDKAVIICTGSQGEPRAALTKIANDDHPMVKLQESDVVLFSSRTIPGNERAIERIKNRLLKSGIEVITDRDAPIHVSGHPYRDELKDLYSWITPQIGIPVHGEQMQMEKHAGLAEDCNVPETIVPHNGQVIKITGGKPEVIDEVTNGMLAVEGSRIVPIEHEAILVRKRIMWHGSAVVTVVVNVQGDLVSAPQVTALGLIDEDCDVDAVYIEGAVDAVKQALSNMPKAERNDDAAISEKARISARKYFRTHFDRNPQTRVHLVRI